MARARSAGCRAARGRAPPDAVALAALDRGRDLLAAQRGHDRGLGVGDGQPVAREPLALQVEVEEVAAGRALREGALRVGQHRQRVLHGDGRGLDAPDVVAQHLHAQRRADAGREHVDARLDRQRDRGARARDGHALRDLRHQLLARDPVRPERAEDALRPRGPRGVEARPLAPPDGGPAAPFSIIERRRIGDVRHGHQLAIILQTSRSLACVTEMPGMVMGM
jgi:hypothetical protein